MNEQASIHVERNFFLLVYVCVCMYMCLRVINARKIRFDSMDLELNLSFLLVYMCQYIYIYIYIYIYVCVSQIQKIYIILVTVAGKKLILQEPWRNQLSRFYYRAHDHQMVQWQCSFPDWSSLISQDQIPAYSIIGIVHSLKNFSN